MNTTGLLGFGVAESIADAHARISNEMPPVPDAPAMTSADLASTFARVGFEVGNEPA